MSWFASAEPAAAFTDVEARQDWRDLMAITSGAMMGLTGLALDLLHGEREVLRVAEEPAETVGFPPSGDSWRWRCVSVLAFLKVPLPACDHRVDCGAGSVQILRSVRHATLSRVTSRL